MKPSSNTRHRVALLVITALLASAAEAGAQQSDSQKPLNLTNRNQTEPSKWYSKMVPWQNKPSQPKLQQTPEPLGKVHNPTEEERAQGQISLARLSERRGQPEQAKTIYMGMIRKYPGKYPLAYHRLGVLAVRQGMYGEARQMFGRALKLDDRNADLLSDIGYSLYLQNQLEEAEIFYRRALTLDGDHEATCNNLAILLAEQGNHRESLALFKRVNDEAKAYSNQAYMLSQIGELDKAKEFYSHALTLDSTIRPAANAMIQLTLQDERLRTKPVGPDSRVHTEIADARPMVQQPANSNNTASAMEQQTRSPQVNTVAGRGPGEARRNARELKVNADIPRGPVDATPRSPTSLARLAAATSQPRPATQAPMAERLPSRQVGYRSGQHQPNNNPSSNPVDFVRQRLKNSNEAARITTPPQTQVGQAQAWGKLSPQSNPISFEAASTKPTSARPTGEPIMARISDFDQQPKPAAQVAERSAPFKNNDQGPQLFNNQSPALSVEPDAWAHIRRASANIPVTAANNRSPTWPQHMPKDMSWWLGTDDNASSSQKLPHPNARPSWLGSKQPKPLPKPGGTIPLSPQRR